MKASFKAHSGEKHLLRVVPACQSTQPGPTRTRDSPVTGGSGSGSGTARMPCAPRICGIRSAHSAQPSVHSRPSMAQGQQHDDAETRRECARQQVARGGARSASQPDPADRCIDPARPRRDLRRGRGGGRAPGCARLAGLSRHFPMDQAFPGIEWSRRAGASRSGQPSDPNRARTSKSRACARRASGCVERRNPRAWILPPQAGVR